MLSFKSDVHKLSKPLPNPPSKDKYTRAEQIPTPGELKRLDVLVEIYQQSPEVRQILKKYKETQ